MTPLAVALASTANGIVGLFLTVLAVLLWRFGRERADGFLAAYLGVVGPTYVVSGILSLLAFWPSSGLAAPLLASGRAVASGAALLLVAMGGITWRVGGDARVLAALLVGLGACLLGGGWANGLDPLPLLLFALVLHGWRPSFKGLVLAGIPTFLLAVVAIPTGYAAANFATPAAPLPLLLKCVFLAAFAAAYGAAFLLVARTYVREADPLRRERLGLLVVALGLVALPRISLVVADLGLVTRPGPPLHAHAVAAMLASLALLFALAAFAMARAGRPEARLHVRRTVRSLGAMLGLVALIWALAPAPGWEEFSYVLLYSGRWCVFAGVFALAVRHHGLLDLPAGFARPVRWTLATLAGSFSLVLLAVLLESLQGSPLPVRLLDSLATVGIAGIVYAAFRSAMPTRGGELSWQRLRVLRAHAELGASEEEMEAARVRLGLTEAEAREVRRLVALERSVSGAAGPEPPAEGGLFLGRYEVERVLGAGAFGRTWAARDRVAGERVVLKELVPSWRRDEEALARFQREAETAMRVQHPNLVGFRGLERTRDGRVLVLEHVEGETLRARLQRGPLSPAEAARVAADVLAGLAELHRLGIVHRDVKPENVMLHPRGRAVLLDFGTVTAGARGTRLSGAPHPGTPAYMSPEQARGDPVGPESDLWSLAATLREALGGAPPPAWRAALRKALDPDPARRWRDARAFRDAIAGIVAR